ncbi:MAG TPA: ATP-dependent DNA ligase, partial [Streptosporangiaceae bacterium]|nr:ATP-dependent DNA ligase [Streptosporangiaceae bacterium]
MSPESRKVPVEVEGRRLALSNLDKVLYPEAGFTKAQVLDYYQRIAPVLLPHIANRPVTIKRYPDGVDSQFFFQKNAPAGTPDWVPTATIASPGSTKSRETIDYIVGGDLPTLI